MAQQEKITRKLDLADSSSVRGIAYLTKTAAYTVSVNDSGKVIIANHASTQVAFTLPAVANCKGCMWFFVSLGAAGMKITGGTADKIVVKNDAARDYVSYETSSEKIGAACMIYSDGSYYYFFEMSGCTVTQSG